MKRRPRASGGATSRVAAATLLVGVAFALATEYVAAQSSGGPTVTAAHVVVDLTVGGGRATVRVSYTLSDDGPATVPVELLPFGETVVDEALVEGAGPIALASDSRGLRTATVPVERTVPPTLRLSYDVAGAVREVEGAVQADVPLLGVALPSAGEAGSLFTVVVEVPEGWTVAEGFPTSLRATAPGRLEATLPVVPSLVGVRGRSDGRWRPGVDLMVELSTGLALLVFLVVGHRRLGRARSE